jgi:hypothetical protein
LPSGARWLWKCERPAVPIAQIARELDADVHTIHGDVAAELAALREQTVEQATELRELEVGRLDAMIEGLWSRVRDGSPPAVSAAVRVSERRARLLGLDAPVVSKSEVTGSLSVYAERLAAERELFATLSIEQLEELAKDSQAVDRQGHRDGAGEHHDARASPAPAVLEGETIDVPPSSEPT